MNIKFKKFCYFFLFLVIFSCSQEKSNKAQIRNEIKANSGIIIHDFEIINYEIEAAIGDYIKTYSIQLDSKNLRQIQNQIQNSKYLNSNFNNNLSLVMGENSKKRWIKMPFGYKFEYYSSKTDEIILYELGIERKIITCYYVKE